MVGFFGNITGKARRWMVICVFFRAIGRLLIGAADLIEYVREPSAAQAAVLVVLVLIFRLIWGWQAQIIW